jgi:NAD(P)H-dependent flavin oxidoreductase YrpB (nitropropane dioxygenase family)
VPEILERVGVELPVVQAGMGGGISAHELAAAVSEAGGLGTIGILPPARLRGEIEAARRLTGEPIAVNLLLPFARRAHWEAASEADVVVTFWGRPERRTGRVWIHQCGSVAEARGAHAAGADAVIAQGVEAGGHVRGHERALELLERARAALPARCPVLLAGGVAAREDLERALEAGAAAGVAGTRFLLSDESRAHPEYKRRLLAANGTRLTELFGAGWPRASHRVVENAATERWLRGDARGPAAVRVVNGLSASVLSRLPVGAVNRLAASQRPGFPFFGPAAPLAGAPAAQVDASPLYAGESVARIEDVRPAGELTRELGA